MDYRALPVPPHLTEWVAGAWTLAATGSDWIEHEATPDGCIELIRRHAGRSLWGTEQPARFATGLSETSIRFGFSPDARFTGITLWPWTWRALGGPACPDFAGRWIAVVAATPIGRLLDGDPLAALAAALPDAPPTIAREIPRADSVAALAAAAGMSHRQVQRWFAATIGLPPRRYLRLLRFRGAMLALPDADGLAGTAAERGYADQAHMTRDFRSLAGTTPGSARRRAHGPFL